MSENTNEKKTEELVEEFKNAKEKVEEANEAIREGKGVLKLEMPIEFGDISISELTYDFTTLTGLDYTESMDSDEKSFQAFRITYRQALSLFAKAAAKHTDSVDARDIIERIGITDAVEGVQLATLFFNASTRSGRLRISKKL